MKRYQVYLNPHSVNILDEASTLSNEFPRSRLIREAIEAAGDRVGNLIAALIKPKVNNYSELDKMTDVIILKGKKSVNISENVDDIYYQ